MKPFVRKCLWMTLLRSDNISNNDTAEEKRKFYLVIPHLYCMGRRRWMNRIWQGKKSVILDLLWLADWLVQVTDLRISLRMGRSTTMLFVILANTNFFLISPPIRKILVNLISYDHVGAVIWESGRVMQRNLDIFDLVFLPIPYKCYVLAAIS